MTNDTDPKPTDTTGSDELFMLFGDALAMPYSEKNEKKMDEAFRIAADRQRELDLQEKQPQ